MFRQRMRSKIFSPGAYEQFISKMQALPVPCAVTGRYVDLTYELTGAGALFRQTKPGGGGGLWLGGPAGATGGPMKRVLVKKADL